MELVKYQTTNKDGEPVTKERYPKMYGKNRKEQKTKEGVDRNKKWGNLTTKEKLSELDKRSGDSKKQRKKILKGVER